jgi:four helix bundle protein
LGLSVRCGKEDPYERISQFEIKNMFDFEKLEVYQKIRHLNKDLLPFIFENQKKYPYLMDELKRASLSIMLNLSEGAGRMTIADKKQFYIRSRSSAFACVSILHILLDSGIIDQISFDGLYTQYERVSKMMLGMIRSLK